MRGLGVDVAGPVVAGLALGLRVRALGVEVWPGAPLPALLLLEPCVAPPHEHLQSLALAGFPCMHAGLQPPGDAGLDPLLPETGARFCVIGPRSLGSPTHHAASMPSPSATNANSLAVAKLANSSVTAVIAARPMATVNTA